MLELAAVNSRRRLSSPALKRRSYPPFLRPWNFRFAPTIKLTTPGHTPPISGTDAPVHMRRSPTS
jgi:hypothetical protein